MHAFIHPLLILFARFPKIGGLVGSIVAMVFGYGAYISWSSLQKMTDHPISVSIEEAANLISTRGSFWATIQQVDWDCTNIIYKNSNDFTQTEALFVDRSATIIGIALFSEPKALACDELPRSNLTGILSAVNPARYEHLSESGFNLLNYQNSTTRLFICTYCGRNNSTLGVIICTIFSLIGLSMYPASLRLRANDMKKGTL